MNVVVLSIEDPYRHSHGGTLRTRALIDGLLDTGCTVTCVFPGEDASATPEHAALDTIAVPSVSLGARRWPPLLQRIKRAALPMPTQTGGRSPGLSAALRELRGVDLLVVSQIAQAGYVDDLNGAGLWLDFSDLHSEFLLGEIAARRGPFKLTAMAQRRQLVALERARAREAAIVTTAGWRDHEVMSARAGVPVAWLPTPVAQPDRRSAASHDPPVAGFLGNFDFWPNRDGFALLLDRWAPALRALGWRVVVAGLRSEELRTTNAVDVLGPVASVSDFYDRVDVSLAPLRLGGGMKVKVVEALLHKRPVVATPFAVEGFPPALRALTHQVDAQDPRFDQLAGGPPPPPEPDAAELQRFSFQGFGQEVRKLVAQL